MAHHATGSNAGRTPAAPVSSIYSGASDESHSRTGVAADFASGVAAQRTRNLPAWLEVDLGAIRRNAERLQRAAGAPLVAMVKADGYGTGAVPVARVLERMGDSLWGFGIATLREAAELRDAGITARMLCATPLLPQQLEEAARLGVRPSLHRAEDIEAWAGFDRPWHLAVDTGMARAGIRWDDAASLLAVLSKQAPEGVFTHFHSAENNDGSRELQEQRFESALQSMRGVLPDSVLVHCDNSAGICARQGAASARTLSRAGIGLYGAVVAESLGLEQTVALRARIIDVRTVRAGESVSYNAQWHADSERRVATLAVGHGDGYRRALSNRGFGLLRGARVPVLGIVTMDMTMIDVTDVSCALGDVVTLIGQGDGGVLSTDRVAQMGQLSPYELLVGLRLRLPRIYHESTGAHSSEH